MARAAAPREQYAYRTEAHQKQAGTLTHRTATLSRPHKRPHRSEGRTRVSAHTLALTSEHVAQRAEGEAVGAAAELVAHKNQMTYVAHKARKRAALGMFPGLIATANQVFNAAGQYKWTGSHTHVTKQDDSKLGNSTDLPSKVSLE